MVYTWSLSRFSCIAFFSVEIVAFLPYLLMFLCWDGPALHILSHSIAALILCQIPKRFIWRFRPYMLSRYRAQMVVCYEIGCTYAVLSFSLLSLLSQGSSDKTSSFPARTVSLGIVITYMCSIIYHHYSNKEIPVYYGFVLAAFILVIFITSCSRVSHMIVTW